MTDEELYEKYIKAVAAAIHRNEPTEEGLILGVKQSLRQVYQWGFYDAVKEYEETA